MYILLICIHALFIGIAQLFGYYIIEGVFVILLLFFLLYFSPIFFFKKSTQGVVSDLFSFELSPQKSLMIPMILTYIGIYLLAFTFSGDIAESIHVHIIIFLGIYIVLLGYIFAFFWKNDTFFDIARFHMIFSYITLFCIGIYYYFSRETLNFLDPIFSLIVIGFSLFFFSYEKKNRREVFQFFLLSLFFAYEIIIIFLFPNITISMLFGFAAMLSLLLFEYGSPRNFFGPFLDISRAFFLAMTLFLTLILVILVFFEFRALYFLVPILIFLFSIHVRYSNVIAYGSGVFLLYFLYAFLFHSLISADSLFGALIFIFFFPIMLIGNTFFWEEKQRYDFAIMHYSSIGFSIAFFLYAAVWIYWGTGQGMIFTAFSVFLLASLFVLSYFRFRNQS